jgi:acetoin utilization deacetylase AcuC-like enzyme
MWGELLSTIGGITAFGGTYYGLYKLGFHMSRKEQIYKMNDRIKDIEELIEYQQKIEQESIEILKQHKQELLEHIEKLNNHKVEKLNNYTIFNNENKKDK